MNQKQESDNKLPPGLRYFPDQVEGYTRISKGKGFAYYFKGALITDPVVLKRLRSLVIPPAWEDVWICPKANGHLQVTGKDIKGRKQYLYHPQWQQLQQENKFARILDFGKALPCIRKNIRKDLRKKLLTREKVTAIALLLMEETLIRAGNGYYRDQNQSYGLTTLTNRHVKIDGSAIFFSFRGKKGVLHKIKVSNRSLAKKLKDVKEITGQSLFQYLDEKGNTCALDSGDLNGYIQRCTKQDFTSKDFRTWYGTVWAFRKLCELQPFENQTQLKKNMVEMYDYVAGKLGNTRTVCKKYYVADTLVDAYENRMTDPYFKKALHNGGKLTEMEKAEKQLLLLLKDLRENKS